MTDESSEAANASDRELGVDFGDLDDGLAEISFPIEHDSLLEQVGDRELDMSDGAVSVREILDPENEGTYESVDDVHQAVLNMVGSEAVGRDRYSDRGIDTDDQSGEDESL